MPLRASHTASAHGSDPASGHGTRKRVRIALFAAAAVLLFLLERLLPNPLPWVRLGLANAVTLVVLWQYGVASAAAVVVLRLLLGGLFSASLLGPQFWLAVSGATASLCVMIVATRLGRSLWSPLGVSVLGSVAHGLAQLLAVALLFGAGRGVLSFLPLFLGVSLITGIITGGIADALLARLELARVPAAGSGGKSRP
jgi:heptaprenyl diphosphate synthase